MLTIENTLLVVVDVQGNLAQAMYDKESLFAGLQKLIRGARVLQLPIIWLEQNPRGLGPTIPEVAGLLTDLAPIPKMSFSCCRCDDFQHALREHGRKQVLMAGIETHICIYQTTLDLLAQGYEVQVVVDAVSSRTALNKQVGLERVRQAGAMWTTAEMCLFEMLGVAEGPQFKEILKIVR